MLRDGGDGRAGLLGGSFCAPRPSGAGERSVPQGWWSWGEGGAPWGGVWIVLPSLSAFVPLFSCIAVSQSHSPGTRRRCRLAGALSESSVRGSRGEESRGEAPTSRSWDRAPLTARA